MKIKFNSDELPLNKTIKTLTITIAARTTNKYYRQVFVDECL